MWRGGTAFTITITSPAGFIWTREKSVGREGGREGGRGRGKEGEGRREGGREREREKKRERKREREIQIAGIGKLVNLLQHQHFTPNILQVLTF